MSAREVPLVCDFVVVVCSGCAAERTEHFDPPLEGAAQIHEWLTTKLGPMPRLVLKCRTCGGPWPECGHRKEIWR